MSGGTGCSQVRLAELVAALSLGVDLGFGQPMEHVLRQCLIALRLADHAGLGEQDRMAVYYTAMLVNVGCHADAHEQAKWFGDDITLKSGKYAHEFGSVRGALATMRLVGAGSPPLHRFRVGLEFALTGHRPDAGGAARPFSPGTRGDRRGIRAVGWARLARRTEGRCGADRSAGRAAGRIHGGSSPGQRDRGRDRTRPPEGRQAVRSGPGGPGVHQGRGDLRWS